MSSRPDISGLLKNIDQEIDHVLIGSSLNEDEQKAERNEIKKKAKEIASNLASDDENEILKNCQKQVEAVKRDFNAKFDELLKVSKQNAELLKQAQKDRAQMEKKIVRLEKKLKNKNTLKIAWSALKVTVVVSALLWGYFKFQGPLSDLKNGIDALKDKTVEVAKDVKKAQDDAVKSATNTMKDVKKAQDDAVKSGVQTAVKISQWFKNLGKQTNESKQDMKNKFEQQKELVESVTDELREHVSRVDESGDSDQKKTLTKGLYNQWVNVKNTIKTDEDAREWYDKNVDGLTKVINDPNTPENVRAATRRALDALQYATQKDKDTIKTDKGTETFMQSVSDGISYVKDHWFKVLVVITFLTIVGGVFASGGIAGVAAASGTDAFTKAIAFLVVGSEKLWNTIFILLKHLPGPIGKAFGALLIAAD